MSIVGTCVRPQYNFLENVCELNQQSHSNVEKKDVLHVHKSLTYLLLHLICSNITLNTAFGKLCGKTMRE